MSMDPSELFAPSGLENSCNSVGFRSNFVMDYLGYKITFCKGTTTSVKNIDAKHDTGCLEDTYVA